MIRKLRLVKVVVQPVFMVDDGETLTPLDALLQDDQGRPAAPITEVAAKEWPSYATTRFVEEAKKLEQHVNSLLEQPPSKKLSK
jgi:hypothetical protein